MSGLIDSWLSANLSMSSGFENSMTKPFPGGQSYWDVVELTRAFLEDLKRWRDGQIVLVIAHSANRWSLGCTTPSGRSRFSHGRGLAYSPGATR